MLYLTELWMRSAGSVWSSHLNSLWTAITVIFFLCPWQIQINWQKWSIPNSSGFKAEEWSWYFATSTINSPGSSRKQTSSPHRASTLNGCQNERGSLLFVGSGKYIYCVFIQEWIEFLVNCFFFLEKNIISIIHIKFEKEGLVSMKHVIVGEPPVSFVCPFNQNKWNICLTMAFHFTGLYHLRHFPLDKIQLFCTRFAVLDMKSPEKITT